MLEKFPLDRVIRYGYSGFLFASIMYAVDPKTFSDFVRLSGPVIAPLMIFAVGICIYVVTRFVIGEYFYFPIMHLIHLLIDLKFGFWNIKKRRNSSVTGLLKELGVPLYHRRTVYTLVRRKYFDASERERLDIGHSEVGVLYTTASLLLCAYLYLEAVPQSNLVFSLFSMQYPKSTFFVFGGIATYIAAVLMDIPQHQTEFWELVSQKDKLRSWLKDRNIIRKSYE